MRLCQILSQRVLNQPLLRNHEIVTNCRTSAGSCGITVRSRTEAANLQRVSPTAIGQTPPAFFGMATSLASASHRGAFPFAIELKIEMMLSLMPDGYANNKWSAFSPECPGADCFIALIAGPTSFTEIRGVTDESQRAGFKS